MFLRIEKAYTGVHRLLSQHKVCTLVKMCENYKGLLKELGIYSEAELLGCLFKTLWLQTKIVFPRSFFSKFNVSENVNINPLLKKYNFRIVCSSNYY